MLPLQSQNMVTIRGIGLLSRTPCLLASANALTHKWGHVSSVHLPCGDLLLGRGHSSHIEGVRAANRPRPDYTWKCYRAMLHTAHSIELLLQNCGPCTRRKDIGRSC